MLYVSKFSLADCSCLHIVMDDPQGMMSQEVVVLVCACCSVYLFVSLSVCLYVWFLSVCCCLSVCLFVQ